MKKIKISLIQPKISSDNNKNFLKIENLIKKATIDNPDLILLPERWYYLDFKEPIGNIIQEERGKQYQNAQKWAKKYNIAIISGGIWEYHFGFQRPFVSTYYFSSDGVEKFRQNKIHLYGAERDFLEPGKNLNIFYDKDLDLTFCILICFDLHISSMLSKLAVSNGCEIIFSPTLIRKKGNDNWKMYLQVRALENRIPIASCNSIFNQFDRKYVGRSKIIEFKEGLASPVKLIVDSASSKECILTRDIDIEFPNKIRKQRLNENLEKTKIKIIKKGF